jgi:hypothetical protein
MRCCNIGLWLAAAAMLVLGGCVTETTRIGAKPASPDHAAAARPLTPDVVAATDRCALRLWDIGGVLLQYFSLNKQLPARLEDLAPLADPGEPLFFVCPLSGKPYGYAPQGLVREGRHKRIIIFDSTPAHDGKRWCVLMPDDLRPGDAQSVEVVPVPEEVFQLYRPANQ